MAKDGTPNVVGEIIRRARLSAGERSAKQMAKRFPANERTIYRYEAGEHLCPSVVVRFYEILQMPELLAEYCKNCPVRQARKKLA